MNIAIEELEVGTVFTYEGVTYKIESRWWHTEGAKKLGVNWLGDRESNGRLIGVIIKLGGVFQPTQQRWFVEGTMVLCAIS